MELFLAVVGGLGTLAWFGMNLNGLFVTLRVPLLSRQRPPLPDHWPSVTIVVAARDEAAVIEPALRSLLAIDYPSLLVIAVDDRSTDGTGNILDQIAGEHDDLTVVHLDDLPEGWLGKTHALAQGFQRTESTYVLFTDADVHFAPHLLRKTIAIAEAERLDHLSLIPRLVAKGPLIGAWMAAFTDGYAARGRGSTSIVHAADAPPFGFGAFNLVRRETFAESEGFEWFRLDVVDDLALGEVLRRAGARRGFLLADEGVEVEWYARLVDALRQLEKNGFGAMAQYRLSRAVAFAAVILGLLLAGPVIALVQDRFTLWPLVVADVVSLVAFQVAASLRYGRSLLHGLLTPVAIVSMGPALLRAAFVTRRLGGVRWRDRVYPLAELRQGQRVRFP